MSQEKEVILEKAEVLLDYITSGIEKGSEFVVEQAPLLAQEILLYGLAYHGVWLATMIIMLIGSIWLFIHSVGELRKNNDDWVGGLFVSVLGGSTFLTFTIVNLLYILKITYAPRVYLLEMLRGVL